MRQQERDKSAFLAQTVIEILIEISPGKIQKGIEGLTYRSGWPSQKLMMGIVMPGIRP
jgi:hypothetical protein